LPEFAKHAIAGALPAKDNPPVCMIHDRQLHAIN
jgi:hypothetical protein